MALDKPNRSHEPADAKGAMTQKRRWLVFGSNVAVAILLATVLAGVVVWLSGAVLRGRTRSDWTTAGRFSLSPRTRALLADLPCEVRITNLYRHSPEDPVSEEQWQRIQDLLAEYETARAKSKITVEAVNPGVDVAAGEALLKRVNDRYAKEAEKPKALVGTFEKLRKDLSAFLVSEVKRFDAAAAAWKDGPPDGVNAFRMVAQRWRQFNMVGEVLASAVQTMTDEKQGLPAYSTAVTRGKDYLKQVSENFAAVPELCAQVQDLVKGAAVPDEVKAVLASAKETYEPLRKRLADFEKEASDLPESELDSIRRDIGQGEAILIETTEKVKVVSFDDVWIRNPKADERSDTAERLFAGEAAVSSALLGVSSKEKPAILFVTSGGPASLFGGPYGEMAERLKKANFIVEDWDLMRQPEMPKVEKASKIILVLAPPSPPNPQMPMPPPSPEQYRLVIDAIKSGAPAILMGEPANMFGPSVPYAELFDLLGVEAKFNAVAVRSIVVDAGGTEKALPQIEITTYAEHPITAPLGALPSMFLTASPLLIKKSLPEGVTAVALANLPASRDYWADTTAFEAMRGQAKRDDAEDIAGPVPLAVAATRKLKEGEQKVVLFGDGDFAQDRVAFYRDMFGREMFPGNAELFVNGILWVSGTEHLITVSPEALQARRIGDLGGWTLPLQILIIGGLPLAVLVAGIIVHVVRRG